MLDFILDALTDSLKLLPFLFITYLVMEALEHHTGDRMKNLIKDSGYIGPLLGGLLGVIPQCGFSAAASSLYACRIISAGTLIAVFLSTSDEMLPIFISESVPVATILRILGTKVALAVISGYLVGAIHTAWSKSRKGEVDIHTVCEEEHCSCQDGMVIAAIKHTLRIFFYIFIISLLLDGAIELIGKDRLTALFSSLPVAGELAAALIGLIPNCASSVMITELYLNGIIGAGPMMAGLLVNAGVGLLVLCRLNRHAKENAILIGTLYVIGVFWGIMIEFMGIVF